MADDTPDAATLYRQQHCKGNHPGSMIKRPGENDATCVHCGLLKSVWDAMQTTPQSLWHGIYGGGKVTP